MIFNVSTALLLQSLYYTILYPFILNLFLEMEPAVQISEEHSLYDTDNTINSGNVLL